MNADNVHMYIHQTYFTKYHPMMYLTHYICFFSYGRFSASCRFSQDVTKQPSSQTVCCVFVLLCSRFGWEYRFQGLLPCCHVALFPWVYDVVELALRHGCRIGSVGRLLLLLVACFLKGGNSLNGTRDEDLETCDPNPW